MAQPTEIPRWLIAVLVLSAAGVGAGGGRFIPTRGTSGPSPEVLEAEMKGQKELFESKMLGQQKLLEEKFDGVTGSITGLKESFDAFAPSIISMAEDAGSTKENVRQMVFDLKAVSSQIEARVEADKAQDEAIRKQGDMIEELRRKIESLSLLIAEGT